MCSFLILQNSLSEHSELVCEKLECLKVNVKYICAGKIQQNILFVENIGNSINIIFHWIGCSDCRA